MASTPLVLVVGSIMKDMTFACAEFPREGQTILGRLNIGQGGKGSNQAIACGRAGARTTFIGATGHDSFAEQVASFYRKEKIGCRLALKKRSATGTAMILINKAGQNQIVIEPGANDHLMPKDVPASLLAGSRVVVTQFESNLTTTTHVLRAARRAGVTTLLNPAPMRADFDPDLLHYVDILIPNESEFVALVRTLPGIRKPGFTERELHTLSGETLHALCRKFGVATLIVTLGERGCFVSEKSGHCFLPAYRNVPVVDTTGAGDAFCGGFVAGLVRLNSDVVEAARFGTAVAALSITKAGATAAMPTQQAIRRFLHANAPGRSRRKSAPPTAVQSAAR
jgi:ribokinase